MESGPGDAVVVVSVAWKTASQTIVGVTAPGCNFFLNQQTPPAVVEVPSERFWLAAVPKVWAQVVVDVPT